MNSEKEESELESNSSSDGEELTDDAIQEAYKAMFDKWVKVCKLNKSLEERVGELVREKEVLMRAGAEYNEQVAEKEYKL